MNTAKTVFLMTLLTLVLVGAGGALGGQGGAFWAMVMAGVMNLGSFWFSDKIVVKRYRGQEVQHGTLSAVVAELGQRNLLALLKVCLLSPLAPNAFAAGRNPEHAVIAATEGMVV